MESTEGRLAAVTQYSQALEERIRHLEAREHARWLVLCQAVRAAGLDELAAALDSIEHEAAEGMVAPKITILRGLPVTPEMQA